MASTNQIQQALARLAQYDDIIEKKKQSILADKTEADCSTEQPINHNKYKFAFVDYCICKLYGVKQPAYRRTGLFDKNTKYTSALYLYFRQKITEESLRSIADDLKSDHKLVGSKIQIILDDQDPIAVAKKQYIQTKLNDFINHV